MQINNWTSLLRSKRLSKTPRDLNNDLIIIGTNTVGNLKKQDTWQPYAMTLADLGAAIGGGGGGVSFQLEAGDYTILQEDGEVVTGPFTPAENSIITIGAVSIPNGLNWTGVYDVLTSDYDYNDVVYAIDPADNTYYTYWMYNDSANPPAGSTLPFEEVPPVTNNTYWAQLGVQGTKGTNGRRSVSIELFQWSSSVPTTFPVGDSVYTWADGTFTNPTLNGWSQTIGAPTPGQTLYKVSQFYSDILTDADSTITWAASTVDHIGYAGANGSTSVGGFQTRLSSGTVNYTIASADVGQVIFADNINDAIITIPSLSDPNYPVGSQTMIVKRSNPGKVTIAAAGGITLSSADNMTRLRSIGSGVTIIKQSATQWYMFGDLVSSLL